MAGRDRRHQRLRLAARRAAGKRPGIDRTARGRLGKLDVARPRLLQLGDGIGREAAARLPCPQRKRRKRRPSARRRFGRRAQVGNDRGGARRRLGAPRERVGLEEKPAVRCLDLVLVKRAGAHVRYEQGPDPGRAAADHRVAAAVPSVEGADDADPLRRRRPDGETGAVGALDAGRVRAEDLEQAVVAAGDEPPFVLGGEHGLDIGVGVAPAPHGAVRRHRQELVVPRFGGRNGGFEQPGRVDPRHHPVAGRLAADPQVNPVGGGEEGADDRRPGLGVRAEHPLRRVVAGLDDPLDIVVAEAEACGGVHPLLFLS